MRIITLLFFCSCILAGNLNGQYQIQLERWVTGISIPTCISHANDDRLFVTEKAGRIRIIQPDGTLLNEAFLDITDRVRSAGGEQGLLGLAFHPEHMDNGYFFVNYTRSDGATVISRFTLAGDPMVADPNSESILLVIPQPFSNHNGGDLHFGPDGYLYISTGDGGSGGDPQDNGQEKLTMLGKILRIDVDEGMPYAIPPDNPFLGDPTTLDEIWALGLRNPWRVSFDRMNGDLWIGDVGQGTWEEVDREPAGSAGGINYGWRCYEGFVPFNTTGCSGEENYTFPVFAYRNNRFGEGCSVTGGYVYRGSNYPVMYGDYLYTDFCSGKFWTLRPDSDTSYFNREVGDFQANEFGALGEDRHGELYAAALSSGIIYRVKVPCLLEYSIEVQHQNCPGEADGAVLVELVTQTGTARFQWSNGDTLPMLDSLMPGTYFVTISDGSCSFTDSVTVDPSTIEACDLFAQTIKICAGDSIRLGACPPPPGYSGQWFLEGMRLEGDTSAVLETSAPGRYTYAYSGPCLVMAEGYIDLALVQPDTPIIFHRDSVVFGPGGFMEYNWTINGDMTSTGADSFIYVNGQDGYYSLVVVDEFGCISAPSDSILVVVGSTRGSVPVQELEVYPNPANEQLFIPWPEVPCREGVLALMDLAGNVLKMEKLVYSGDVLTVRLEGLPSGIYHIEMNCSAGRYLARFTIQKAR